MSKIKKTIEYLNFKDYLSFYLKSYRHFLRTQGIKDKMYLKNINLLKYPLISKVSVQVLSRYYKTVYKTKIFFNIAIVFIFAHLVLFHT